MSATSSAPHATVWGTWKGKHKTNDLQDGNGYLPHTGVELKSSPQTRGQLSADDVAHHQQKKGRYVILVENFNARVGRHEGPVLKDLPPPRETPLGETTQNRSGTDLLEMCDELDL
jgi:hypothetical protein